MHLRISSTRDREDRERDLQEQLASDLPATDMAVYLDAMYFRLDENRFFVPVSLIVPGSQIPFVVGGDKDKATLDIAGEVIDEVKRPIGNARETVKLKLDPSLQAKQKNIQYTTSFNLPPGKYHLKFVVRENQTGRMGSFETDITLPDLRSTAEAVVRIACKSETAGAEEQADESAYSGWAAMGAECEAFSDRTAICICCTRSMARARSNSGCKSAVAAAAHFHRVPVRINEGL